MVTGIGGMSSRMDDDEAKETGSVEDGLSHREPMHSRDSGWPMRSTYQGKKNHYVAGREVPAPDNCYPDWED